MFLSPAKLLVILVVALVVLGPEKLPGVARQLGALWGDLRRWRMRLEREVRGIFPDLPSSHEITQAVRSPLSYLDKLADEHERGSGDAVTASGSDAGAPLRSPPSTGNGAGHGDRAWLSSAAAAATEPPPSVPDDPSMN
ncbi:MAG TPA: twin-arginine translocase TatA/TatE family subunit [Acidimicrobiales bacterium]|nr:twin-arginine translocase TatA/TatE family subunit [Acidimicrobiales bacterium]